MRGTVAKRLRRAIYGDKSLRARTYHTLRFKVPNPYGKIGSDGKLVLEPRAILVADDLRQKYQQAKRDHVATRRGAGD